MKSRQVCSRFRVLSGKLYLIGGIATPGESRAQAGEELITVDTANWVCTRKFTTGAGPEFTDSHAAVIAGSTLFPLGACHLASLAGN